MKIKAESSTEFLAPKTAFPQTSVPSMSTFNQYLLNVPHFANPNNWKALPSNSNFLWNFTNPSGNTCFDHFSRQANLNLFTLKPFLHPMRPVLNPFQWAITQQNAFLNANARLGGYFNQIAFSPNLNAMNLNYR